MSTSDETDDAGVVAAVKNYMVMLDAGEAPPLEDFLLQHAAIAEDLRPALEGLAFVHKAADPKPDPRGASSSITAPDAEFTAKPIGDFQIVGELGRGGMGVVYEAVQLSLGRHVALKVLPFASGLDEVRLQRFRNEAHAAAALHHTNIVPVYAVGSDRGVHYYAMQLIDGSTLAELIEHMRAANRLAPDRSDETRSGTESKPRGLETFVRHSTVLSSSQSERKRYYRKVVHMAHQAATALQHAHQYGVIHRDIKPANLLLDSTDKIWVADFGLAQVQSDQSHLTRTGDPMGTLRYMSPEQAAGRRDDLDHRTDIYSLGVTLYEMLTLQPAISGAGYREMLNNVALHEPPAPKTIDPSLPLELDTILRKAIAKIPAERYASAGEFADDLQAWLDDKPIAAKPPTVIERFSKWRRRNSGLVTVASGFLLLATLGLLATTLMIWREQRATADALVRATEQRLLAQRSFDQARSAVDTFSSLSESELAYRPQLNDLRRSFLETSLSFYQDFLEDRADDPALKSELEETSSRVQSLVDELQVLDNIAPYFRLVDPRVQKELNLSPGEASEIELAVEAFQEEREAAASDLAVGLTTDREANNRVLQEFEENLRQRLTSGQRTRLLQISRQMRLPFTFKTSEIKTLLGLTREQSDDINRIIEETRPGGGPRIGDPMSMGGPGGGPGDGPPGGRGSRGRGGPFGGPPGGGRDRFEGGPNDPGGRPPNDFRDRQPPDFWRSQGTENTVRHILEILTPDQRNKWAELIGPPF